MKRKRQKNEYGVKDGDLVILFGQEDNVKRVVKKNGEFLLQNRHKEINGIDYGFPNIKNSERDDFGFFGFLPHFKGNIKIIGFCSTFITP